MAGAAKAVDERTKFTCIAGESSMTTADRLRPGGCCCLKASFSPFGTVVFSAVLAARVTSAVSGAAALEGPAAADENAAGASTDTATGGVAAATAACLSAFERPEPEAGAAKSCCNSRRWAWI